MNIAIVGAGYVGLVSGTCFTEMGVDVTCVDINEEKIKDLLDGQIPIYEPELNEMVLYNHREGRLSFATDLRTCLDSVNIAFSVVGAPPGEDGNANLTHVLEIACTVERNISKYILLVTKSTVLIGTAQKVKKAIHEELEKRGVDIEFDVASNPEFLKESAAIQSSMRPDRVVVGIESERTKELISRLYHPVMLNNFRVIFTGIPSAEMAKYVADSILATRTSFMNDIANLCELVGADVNIVRKGTGADTRTGSKFLYPGCGYGGSCFPKDVKALAKTAESRDYKIRMLKAVKEVNKSQKHVAFNKLYKHYNDEPREKVTAIWGLAFKPETGDIREATTLITINQLTKTDCKAQIFNPVAMDECKHRVGEGVTYAKDMYDAVLNAGTSLSLTEWEQFRLPSWGVLKRTMSSPIIIDRHSIYDPVEMMEKGVTYYYIGR